MTKIIFKSLSISHHGKGKKRRPSILGVFYDQARPGQLIRYSLSAINNAITQRELKQQERVGLEMGKEVIVDEFKRLSVIPPMSQKANSCH